MTVESEIDDNYLRELALKEILKQARRMTSYNDWINYKRKLAQALTQYDKLSS